MFLPGRHFSPFKLFLDREAGVALMLNPKVLTTFTRRLLADGYCEFRGRDDPSDGRYRPLKVPRRFPVAPLRDYLHFLRRPQDYALYALVRNPYGRISSAWRNKFLDGHNASPDGSFSAYPRSIRWHHLKQVRRFAASRGLAGALDGELVPFETFLHYAADRPEGQRDHHWDSQCTVLMTDRLAYTRVFRMEDELDEAFLLLGERLGFPADWVRARLQKPANPSKATAKVYDEALAALAHRLCASDCARFGYATDSWRAY